MADGVWYACMHMHCGPLEKNVHLPPLIHIILAFATDLIILSRSAISVCTMDTPQPPIYPPSEKQLVYSFSATNFMVFSRSRARRPRAYSQVTGF